MNNKNLDTLITEALAIEAEEANQVGALGYMAKCLVQASLPYRDPGNIPAWGRQNGNFSLVIQPGYTMKNGNTDCIGFPYGSIPRLLLAWITTEAVRTKDKTLTLGKSLSEFMSQLDLVPTGGRWGSIWRLKEQTKRLLSSHVSCSYDEEDGFGLKAIQIADKAMLWWDIKEPEKSANWQSIIELNKNFFDAITGFPVPVDMRALNALKRSPMALDIYCWLTYRMSYVKSQSSTIPWELLQLQFGSGYEDTPQGKQGFKRNFIKQLNTVQIIYQQSNVDVNEVGVVLRPSKTHIKTIK